MSTSIKKKFEIAHIEDKMRRTGVILTCAIETNKCSVLKDWDQQVRLIWTWMGAIKKDVTLKKAEW